MPVKKAEDISGFGSCPLLPLSLIMNSLRIESRLLFLALCSSLFPMSVINADIAQVDSFEAWCISGKGTKYWYDRTKNRITSDHWTELDGTGFTGGAYVFRYSGGDEVTLGKRRLPIQVRNGHVMVFSESKHSPTSLRSDTYLIHTKLRKIVRTHAQSLEFSSEDRSVLRVESTIMDCDWR